MLDELTQMLEAGLNIVLSKILEEIHGFFIYVMQKYKVIQPYIMGIHLSIDLCQPRCEENGW